MLTSYENPSQNCYTFNEHKHRYAVWTAARAVQRSFTTSTKISTAINASSLRTFSESSILISQGEYDEKHREWCNCIISCFARMKVPCSYGRAAKIVAIYLKTSYILPTMGEGTNCSVIHPPIDRILLHALAKGEHQYLKNYSWTLLTEEKYWELVDKMRVAFPRFDWTLEKDWKAETDDELL
jgi:hypothetical protein